LDSTYALVLVGEKTHCPSLDSVYREAIRNVPRLNRMPDRGSVSFGTRAFEQWASDLESGKLGSLAAEDLGFWQHYGGYLVTLYTNMYGQHFTQRAIEACPDHPGLSRVPALIEEMIQVCDFAAVGGNFDVDPQKLRDRRHMAPICAVIRKCAEYNEKIIAAMEASE
jgi:hypothetical protein